MQFPRFQARTSSIPLPLTMALRALFLLVIAALVASPPLFAQYRASIQGTVMDTQGGVIPGAKLTLTNLATN